MNDSKAWYSSKTLWFNAVMSALTLVEANTGIFQPFLPVNFYAILIAALPVVNSGLRLITTKALTATAK